jgi:hypothetical protein
VRANFAELAKKLEKKISELAKKNFRRNFSENESLLAERNCIERKGRQGY